MTKEKKQYRPDYSDDTMVEHQLVLYNDDVNTFEHVINCLVEICNHSAEQAEQCSIIVHYKGKCTVKSGGFDDLRIMCEKLCVEGLSAVVE